MYSIANIERGRIVAGAMGSPIGKPYGYFLIDSVEPGWKLAIICDDGNDVTVPESLGWEHVSVRATRGAVSRVPTWREMAHVKSLVWSDDDVCVQYHPRRAEYVNCHPHVLHLWCSRVAPMPTPPPFLVGALAKDEP